MPDMSVRLLVTIANTRSSSLKEESSLLACVIGDSHPPMVSFRTEERQKHHNCSRRMKQRLFILGEETVRRDEGRGEREGERMCILTFLPPLIKTYISQDTHLSI